MSKEQAILNLKNADYIKMLLDDVDMYWGIQASKAAIKACEQIYFSDDPLSYYTELMRSINYNSQLYYSRINNSTFYIHQNSDDQIIYSTYITPNQKTKYTPYFDSIPKEILDKLMSVITDIWANGDNIDQFFEKMFDENYWTECGVQWTAEQYYGMTSVIMIYDDTRYRFMDVFDDPDDE